MTRVPTWEFATAARILFGRGVSAQAPTLIRAMGSRVLVVTGARVDRARWLVEGLRGAGADCEVWPVAGEPTVPFVLEAAAGARRARRDAVAAIGGGSALDAGKAIAALATNDGDPLDYLEVVGRGLPLRVAPLPCVALPTTAGTGSEVTRNAVLSVPERRVKVSLRSPLMLPRLAVVDPALTASVPPDITAYTGLDALTQNIEPLLSARATPLTDGLCREGIARAARSLRRACGNGADLEAREDMAVASLCGGLALANAGLGAVHGLAGPVGGMFAAPHGAVCAALLAPVMRANIEALTRAAPGHPALARAREVAAILTGAPDARAHEAADWLEALARDVGVPGLSRWGLASSDVPAIVDQAARASSMAANPVVLEAAALAACVRAAL